MKSEIKQRVKKKVDLPESLLGVIPERVRESLYAMLTESDLDALEEIRLRDGRALAVKIRGEYRIFSQLTLTEEDIDGCVRAMCKASLYAHIDSINHGYITLGGGIRVGIAGEVRREEGKIVGLCRARSLCIRIPHALRIAANEVCELLIGGNSVLIYSKAGVGKTTLLRSLAAQLSDAKSEAARNVVLVDTREELFWGLDGEYMMIDVLMGYPKGKGIEIATRVMSADVIVCDEIGADEVEELLFCTNCGISVLSSAHAGSIFELLRRDGIEKLHRRHVFSYYVGISRNCRGCGFDYDIISWEEANAVFKDDR